MGTAKQTCIDLQLKVAQNIINTSLYYNEAMTTFKDFCFQNKQALGRDQQTASEKLDHSHVGFGVFIARVDISKSMDYKLSLGSFIAF